MEKRHIERRIAQMARKARNSGSNANVGGNVPVTELSASTPSCSRVAQPRGATAGSGA